MSPPGPEADYLLSRAKQESLMALRAFNPAAEAAHRELSLRYTAGALAECGIALPRKGDKRS